MGRKPIFGFSHSLSNAEYAIQELSNSTIAEVQSAREDCEELTYFEMREALKGPGLRYAYRRSYDELEWVTRYDADYGVYVKTDFETGYIWEPTIEDIQSDDWIVYKL